MRNSHAIRHAGVVMARSSLLMITLRFFQRVNTNSTNSLDAILFLAFFTGLTPSSGMVIHNLRECMPVQSASPMIFTKG